MDFSAFDTSRMEEYAAQAKASWGDTAATAESAAGAPNLYRHTDGIPHRCILPDAEARFCHNTVECVYSLRPTGDAPAQQLAAQGVLDIVSYRISRKGLQARSRGSPAHRHRGNRGHPRPCGRRPGGHRLRRRRHPRHLIAKNPQNLGCFSPLAVASITVK